MATCPSNDRNNPMYESNDPHVEPPNRCDGCAKVIEAYTAARPLRWSPYFCAKCNQEIDDLQLRTADY
jgi:hypothetical protein